MRVECQEWSAQDEFGDRDDMGVHIYSEDQIMRIIANGGVVEINGLYLNNHYDVENYFVE